MQYKQTIAVCSQIHIKDINTLRGQNVQCLGAFAKLQKANNIFVMSIRLSARNNSAPTGHSLMKFDI